MIELLNVNCEDYMKSCKTKQFDIAIVDPPFGIGATWAKSKRDVFFKSGRDKQYQNESIPGREYFKQLFRISKNQIIWGGNYYTKFLPPTNAWIVWDKNRDSEKTFMSEGELAWTSFNKVLQIKTWQWDGGKKCETVERIHPHQKPVKLYKWLIDTYAGQNSKIFDSHLGSGSIAIACHDYKVSLAACEIDPHYYQSAVTRFNNHKAQQVLF